MIISLNQLIIRNRTNLNIVIKRLNTILKIMIVESTVLRALVKSNNKQVPSK